MDKEELKKKILPIVRGTMLEADELPFLETTDNIADALIAAGYGDVKEAEAEANRYEMLYKLQNQDMALAERRAHDAEHRAEVEGMALRVLARKVVIFAFPNGDWKELIEQLVSEAKEQAEKELAEEGKDEQS